MRYAARFYEEDGGWVAEIKEVGGHGIATQGDSLPDCREMARDAVTEVLLARFESDLDPNPSSESLPEGYEWVYPYQAAWTAIQVRLARKARGLTVAEAASACKVAAPTYIRWEDPYKSNATIKTLERVAGAFGRQVQVTFL
jgi:predicted RNase H-like HicB family nuclease/DNA-binding XRE family transcriptional regulator